jgi:hypothetical protein
MTDSTADAERLAEIRHRHSPIVSSHVCSETQAGRWPACEQATLLRLIDVRDAEIARLKETHLFVDGEFTAHSGGTRPYKIECDALTDEDLATQAANVARQFPRFSYVYGVPRGGVRFESALRKYATNNPLDPILIVDDVMTTGASMQEARERLGQNTFGIVIFSLCACPDWITPLFSSHEARDAEIARQCTFIHPWYGPCDALGPNGECAECLKTARVQGHNEPCITCGKPCSALAGNPARWPIRLDNNGWRHIGCVNAEIARLKQERDEWKDNYKAVAPSLKSASDLCERLEDERDAAMVLAREAVRQEHWGSAATLYEAALAAREAEIARLRTMADAPPKDKHDADRLVEARQILGERNSGCWVYDGYGRQYCDERLAKALGARDAEIARLNTQANSLPLPEAVAADTLDANTIELPHLNTILSQLRNPSDKLLEKITIAEFEHEESCRVALGCSRHSWNLVGTVFKNNLLDRVRAALHAAADEIEKEEVDNEK